MTVHLVATGDCLARLAATHGFANWSTVSQCPENADLRLRRPDPNLLAPGDRIFIPTRTVGAAEAQTGTRHRFVRRSPRTRLRISFRDEAGHPLANVRYRFTSVRGTIEGTTSSKGLIDQPIDPTLTFGTLELWETENMKLTFDLKIGDLGPVEEISGATARLRHLGFGPFEQVDDDQSETPLWHALKAFQEHCGLPATGNLDAATRDTLYREHDLPS